MDLTDWAKSAARGLSEVASSMQKKQDSSRVLIRTGDRIGKTNEEARLLAEDPAYLKNRAVQNRHMEAIRKALQ
jgi:hypothetical protein